MVFTIVQALTKQTKHTHIAYNWIINLSKILRDNLKNVQDILVIIFEIEINIKNLIARLLNDKLEKTVKANSKFLTK